MVMYLLCSGLLRGLYGIADGLKTGSGDADCMSMSLCLFCLHAIFGIYERRET